MAERDVQKDFRGREGGPGQTPLGHRRPDSKAARYGEKRSRLGIVGGVGLILRACYLYLAILLGQATATLLVGLVTLLMAGGLVWSARQLSR
jgi:hypothetical protein